MQAHRQLHVNVRSRERLALRGTVLAAGISALLFSAAAIAGPTATLTRMSGAPSIFEVTAERALPVSLVKPGRDYALPLEVVTGANDSASFTLPNSFIEVSPNTVMRIVAPETNERGIVQRVLQRSGASLFSVKKGSVEHFQVDTPFLVSVVKGTTFTILVEDIGATVSLHEGSLLVSSVDGSQRVLLAPGGVAFAGRDGLLRELKLETTQAGTQLRDSQVKSEGTAVSESVDAARSVVASSGEQLIESATDPVGGVVKAVANTTESVVAASTTTMSTVASDPVGTVTAAAAPVLETTVAVTTSTLETLTTVASDPVTTVAAPLVDPTASVTTTTIDTVTTVAPPVDPVVTAVITEVVVPVVDPIVEPLAPATDPGSLLAAPILEAPATVTAPLADPIGGAVGGVLGGLR